VIFVGLMFIFKAVSFWLLACIAFSRLFQHFFKSSKAVFQPNDDFLLPVDNNLENAIIKMDGYVHSLNVL